MPSEEWLKTAFRDGYSSGDLTSPDPDTITKNEEERVGGSYRDVLDFAIKPFLTPNSRVLELGPGAGSWTRALLKCVPDGEVHTLDFVDVTKFINPRDYNGRLFCHIVTDNNYEFLPDGFFDFFFSFGVLCHTMPTERRDILRGALPKTRPRAYSVHQYGDWNKLEDFGWDRGGVPTEFRDMPDDKIWWPRNTSAMMAAAARAAGWRVITPDMDLLRRDGLILLSH